MQATKRFIRRPELVAKVGLCATTIFNLERAGKFPQHILLTPRVAVWDETEVDAWMRDQMTKAAPPARVPGPRKRATATATAAASMPLSHQLAQALQGATKPPRQST